MRTVCERCGQRKRLLSFVRQRGGVVVEQRWFCRGCMVQVRDLVTDYQLYVEGLLRDRGLL